MPEPNTPRLHCVVPFCRRTRGLRKGEACLPGEWICGDHWRLVDRRLKRLRSLNRRRYKLTRKGVVRECRLWEWCKRQAIERAGGIA